MFLRLYPNSTLKNFNYYVGKRLPINLKIVKVSQLSLLQDLQESCYAVIRVSSKGD